MYNSINEIKSRYSPEEGQVRRRGGGRKRLLDSHPEWFETYETIGGLFAEVTGETVELSVVQRIWGLIVEVINVITEFISCNPFELIENVINNNNQIKAV